jgi:hypothetical protein
MGLRLDEAHVRGDPRSGSGHDVAASGRSPLQDGGLDDTPMHHDLGPVVHVPEPGRECAVLYPLDENVEVSFMRSTRDGEGTPQKLPRRIGRRDFKRGVLAGRKRKRLFRKKPKEGKVGRIVDALHQTSISLGRHRFVNAAGIAY